MQAAEDAQGSLAERVESLGVSEREKTAGEEKTEETTEAPKETVAEDYASMHTKFVFCILY